MKEEKEKRDPYQLPKDARYSFPRFRRYYRKNISIVKAAGKNSKLIKDVCETFYLAGQNAGLSSFEFSKNYRSYEMHKLTTNFNPNLTFFDNYMYACTKFDDFKLWKKGEYELEGIFKSNKEYLETSDICILRELCFVSFRCGTENAYYSKVDEYVKNEIDMKQVWLFVKRKHYPDLLIELCKKDYKERYNYDCKKVARHYHVSVDKIREWCQGGKK